MVQVDSAATVHRLEAQTVTAMGKVCVARREWVEPIDVVIAGKDHYVQVPLRHCAHDGRACFLDRWNPNRFEPIGPAFLVPASEVVHFKSNCRQYSSVDFAFSAEAIQRWFDGELEWTDDRLKGSLDIVDPAIKNLLSRVGEEVRTPGFASETLVELICAQVVIELARYCIGIDEPRAAGGLAAWRMRLIEERLAEPGARPSLTELADLCNLSARHLTRAFRISRGCSIGSYIARSRIDQAQRLLASGQNVKSIAHGLGFSSPSHFYLAFHRATGVTPRQYRERMGRTISITATS